MSDGTAGQMDGEAGWWTTSGKIEFPPLARVKGVVGQQHDNLFCIIEKYVRTYENALNLLGHIFLIVVIATCLN